MISVVTVAAWVFWLLFLLGAILLLLWWVCGFVGDLRFGFAFVAVGLLVGVFCAFVCLV